MKARFKCKDGFNLTGPGGKEVIDENEYVLTCAFGNWTGTTPACQELFCAFPGYVEHGKILLIGNMGLYDYRPYVKKVWIWSLTIVIIKSTRTTYLNHYNEHC